MPKLVTYHEQYYGMKELAEKIENHHMVKDKGLVKSIHLLALSNDHGVDFSMPQQECEFRRMLSDRGYRVARREQDNNSLGVSQSARMEKVDEVVKIAVAFLYRKNGLLKSEKAEEN